MIFPGRILASAEGITIWGRKPGEGYELHLLQRGVVVELSAEELEALARLAPEAVAAAASPEAPADRARRLQILQARVNDYIRRERGPGAPDGT